MEYRFISIQKMSCVNSNNMFERPREITLTIHGIAVIESKRMQLYSVKQIVIKIKLTHLT